MLQEIKSQEIMTTRAAREKYRTQYFIMIMTDIVDRGDNDLGYVLYAADSKRELLKIPRDEYKDKPFALRLGVAAEPYPIIGNVVYHDLP